MQIIDGFLKVKKYWAYVCVVFVGYRLAPPVFGSSANLEALAMDFNSKSVVHGEESDDSQHSER